MIYAKSYFSGAGGMDLGLTEVARAWVLGVWRVEETGEIVKLEEDK